MTALPFAAFRGGLLSRRELLSHCMHADGLPSVVPGPNSWRVSATSRSERMPTSAPDEFLGALEQPTRLPSASPTTNDHSLSLLTGSLPPEITRTYRNKLHVLVATCTPFPKACFKHVSKELPKLGARQDQPARPGFLCLRKSVFREAGMQPQGLTRKSISVPPCSFTLLFSELTIEPSFVFSAIDNFRFEIPTTPWVFPVTG